MKKPISKKKRREPKKTFKLADCISCIDALEMTQEHVDLCIYAYYKMCEVKGYA